MHDDDDLPVLTQVLVTASGRAPSVAIADERRGEPVPPGALVIGNDPDDPDDPSLDFGTGPAVAAGRPTLRDVFSTTVPNGDDHVADGHPLRLDEPHLDRGLAGWSSLLDDIGDERAHAGGVDAFGASPRRVGGGVDDAPQAVIGPSSDQDAVIGAVRDEVLDRLAARIDTELDARIAQTIRVELDTAIAQLQARLRSELSEALRDVVGNAIDEAIRRRRSESGSASDIR